MELNPRNLHVRFELCNVLERMGAYAKCSEQLAALLDLKMQLSDRLYAIYLRAQCLDRAGCHKECMKFCDGWLTVIDEQSKNVSIPEVCRVRLERVRTITTFDGFCFGASADRHLDFPNVFKFFNEIVRNEQLREADDFYYLAMHYEWVGDFESAFNELARAESLFPDHWRIPFRRACLLGQLGQQKAALECAQTATTIAPWQRQAWAVLATCLRQVGRESEARAASNRAAEIKKIRSQLTEQVEA